MNDEVPGNKYLDIFIIVESRLSKCSFWVGQRFLLSRWECSFLV